MGRGRIGEAGRKGSQVSIIHYIDPQGRKVHCYPVEGRKGDLHFSVEVVRDGEVEDHYTLYGHTGLTFTARKKRWKEVSR